MKRLYKPTPDGYCGDEDNGQTSAWFVFSALGFYPVCPVTGEFAIGSPLFKEVDVTMADGKVMTISAEKNSADNVYIQQIKVNGRMHDTNYFTYKDLIEAPNIEMEMGNLPNKSRGVVESSFPYSYSCK